MKYPYGFGIIIPYLDATTDPVSASKSLISTNDRIDRRRVKRGVRRWIKSELGHKVHTSTLRLYLKRIMVHDAPKQYIRMPSAQINGEASSVSEAGDTTAAAG